MSKYLKPPIGVMPEFIAIEKANGNLDNTERLNDLTEAFKRYLEARFPMPIKWIEEFNRRSRAHHSERGSLVSDRSFLKQVFEIFPGFCESIDL
jgi:hypothetical protein